jgi:hypothetical protein
MAVQETTERPNLVLIRDRSEAPETPGGRDLAHFLRLAFGPRGADWPAWEGAVMPSGEVMTRERWAAYVRLLVRARLATRAPVKDAPVRLLATKRQALAALAGLL